MPDATATSDDLIAELLAQGYILVIRPSRTGCSVTINSPCGCRSLATAEAQTLRAALEAATEKLTP
jgi:hypothetical protein